MRRFWDKVLKTERCWEWQAGCHPRDGYGHFWLEGRTVRAHRVSYELTKGSIPEGSILLHSCDNPRCVNPDHLRIGTHKDNAIDRESKGRANRVKGSSHKGAKLTEAAIKQAKALRNAGALVKDLAAAYGVSAPTMSKALSGKKWRHL